MNEKNSTSKKYSITRYNASTEKLCQKCSSSEHWTYECPHKSKTQGLSSLSRQREMQESLSKRSKSSKLSPSQMLKYGVKRKRHNFEPELTEKEEYNLNLKQAEKELIESLQRDNSKTSSTKKIDNNIDNTNKLNESISLVKQEITEEEISNVQGNAEVNNTLIRNKNGNDNKVHCHDPTAADNLHLDSQNVRKEEAETK